LPLDKDENLGISFEMGPEFRFQLSLWLRAPLGTLILDT